MKLCDNCDAPLTRDWRECGMCGLLNPARRPVAGPETTLEATANSLTACDHETMFRRALTESEIDGTGYCFVEDAWGRYIELTSK